MAAIFLPASAIHEIESEENYFDDDEFWTSFIDEDEYEPTDEELDLIFPTNYDESEF